MPLTRSELRWLPGLKQGELPSPTWMSSPMNLPITWRPSSRFFPPPRLRSLAEVCVIAIALGWMDANDAAAAPAVTAGIAVQPPAPWSGVPPLLNPQPDPSTLIAHAEGNGCRVAIHRDGRLLWSADGAGWRAVGATGQGFVRGLAFGNNRFVAVGGSYLDRIPRLLSSRNGRTWRLVESPCRGVLHAVTFGNGQFVAVGSDGLILASGKRNRWALCHSGSSATLTTVSCRQGVLVATGDDGIILDSIDGIHWTIVGSIEIPRASRYRPSRRSPSNRP